jgi:hypothetical protein
LPTTAVLHPYDGRSNYFEGIGPLVVGQQVVTVGSDRPELGSASGYGPFTGTLPILTRLLCAGAAQQNTPGILPSLADHDARSCLYLGIDEEPSRTACGA